MVTRLFAGGEIPMHGRRTSVRSALLGEAEYDTLADCTGGGKQSPTMIVSSMVLTFARRERYI